MVSTSNSIILIQCQIFGLQMRSTTFNMRTDRAEYWSVRALCWLALVKRAWPIGRLSWCMQRPRRGHVDQSAVQFSAARGQWIAHTIAAINSWPTVAKLSSKHSKLICSAAFQKLLVINNEKLHLWMIPMFIWWVIRVLWPWQLLSCWIYATYIQCI